MDMKNRDTFEDRVDLVLDIGEVDWIISDTHFSHKNIIKYCRNEHFAYSWDGVENMNWKIMSQWNSVVDPDDTVLFLGDLVWLRDLRKDTNQVKIDDLYNILNGNIIPVRGEHDQVKPSFLDEWNYSALIVGKNRKYMATHFPGNTPDSRGGMDSEFKEEIGDLLRDWGGWIIHGHHHNNYSEEYPLFNFSEGLVNCSIEMVGEYSPLSMERVKDLIDERHML